MSTPSLLMGLRAYDGVRGVFLAREGVNVEFAGDSDLLISPFDANLMIIARGLVYVPYGGVATVYFPEAAAAPPMVCFTGFSGFYTLPMLSYHMGVASAGDRIVVTSYVNRVTFYNRLSEFAAQVGFPVADLTVRYFVFAKDAS